MAEPPKSVRKPGLLESQLSRLQANQDSFAAVSATACEQCRRKHKRCDHRSLRDSDDDDQYSEAGSHTSASLTSTGKRDTVEFTSHRLQDAHHVSKVECGLPPSCLPEPGEQSRTPHLHHTAKVRHMKTSEGGDVGKAVNGYDSEINQDSHRHTRDGVCSAQMSLDGGHLSQQTDSHLSYREHDSRPPALKPVNLTARGKRRGRPPRSARHAPDHATNDRQRNRNELPTSSTGTQRHRSRKRRCGDDYEYSQRFNEIILGATSDLDQSASKEVFLERSNNLLSPIAARERPAGVNECDSHVSMEHAAGPVGRPHTGITPVGPLPRPSSRGPTQLSARSLSTPTNACHRHVDVSAQRSEEELETPSSSPDNHQNAESLRLRTRSRSLADHQPRRRIRRRYANIEVQEPCDDGSVGTSKEIDALFGEYAPRLSFVTIRETPYSSVRDLVLPGQQG